MRSFIVGEPPNRFALVYRQSERKQMMVSRLMHRKGGGRGRRRIKTDHLLLEHAGHIPRHVRPIGFVVADLSSKLQAP